MPAQTKQQEIPWWRKFLSRKFLLSILVIVLILGREFFGLDIQEVKEIVIAAVAIAAAIAAEDSVQAIATLKRS